LIRVIYRLHYLRKRKAAGEKIGRDVMVSSKHLKGMPAKFWLSIFFSTVWSWVSRFLVINFLLMAFFELGFGDHLLILARQLVIWLIMLVTPTPGGSGMAEFLCSEFLGDLIAGVGIAIALAFIWRLISYYLYLIIGSILLPKWLRK